MTRRMKLMIAAGLGLAVMAGGTAYAMAGQGDAAAQLRASGAVGEQADGYLGLVALHGESISGASRQSGDGKPCGDHHFQTAAHQNTPGFCWISSRTSPRSDTTTSCRMLMLRLISIGRSGAVTWTHPASMTGRPRTRILPKHRSASRLP